MPRKYQQEENAIRKTISHYLDALKIPHTVTDAGVIKIGEGQYRPRGVDPGWPDITGVIPCSVSPLLAGRLLAVEVKTKTGKLLPGRLVKRGWRQEWVKGQKEVLEDLRQAGAVAIVARSIEDVTAGLCVAEQAVRDGVDFLNGLPELK